MSKLRRSFAFAALLVAIVAPIRVVQAQERGARSVDAAKVKGLDEAAKREWLREKMTAMAGARRGAEIRERVGRLDAGELDRLIESYFRQLAIAQANLRRGGRTGRTPYGYGYAPYGRGAVGYQPMISWLPTGTSLNTGAVVSPDGRSVRINAQPFFSSVPYYDTFNMYNGQTRRYYVQGQPQQPRRPTATPYRYHDGLRTHTKPPQFERYNDGLRTRYRPIQR